MSRTLVPLDELHAILDAEYQRLRPVECKSCVTPLPVRRRPPDEVSTNWFITTPSECTRGCAGILGEIVARLMVEYELERTVFGARRT